MPHGRACEAFGGKYLACVCFLFCFQKVFIFLDIWCFGWCLVSLHVRRSARVKNSFFIGNVNEYLPLIMSDISQYFLLPLELLLPVLLRFFILPFYCILKSLFGPSKDTNSICCIFSFEKAYGSVNHTGITIISSMQPT